MTAQLNKIRLGDFRNNQLSRCVLLILHYLTFCVQSTIEMFHLFLMFHLFHGTLPIHLQNRFSRYSTTRSTRRINTFVMVQARTNIKAMCLSVYGVKLWNSLSNNLRDCNSVTIFKNNLKKYLISIY